jgi:hypothetical protein
LASPPDLPDIRALAGRRHLLIGWWSIFVFSALGLALETLHGFKVGVYVDVANDTRRLMWTLAHAHGTLLGLVHIAFSTTLPAVPAWDLARQRLASQSLMAATALLPGGFFAAGVQFYAGDPGIGVALVPVGAVLLLLAAWLIARAVHARRDTAPPKSGPPVRKRTA